MDQTWKSLFQIVPIHFVGACVGRCMCGSVHVSVHVWVGTGGQWYGCEEQWWKDNKVIRVKGRV